MPTVPGLIPSVAPTEAATPAIRVSADAKAFGAPQANALGELSRAMEHSGDEIFARALALQNLRNESEAKEADAQYALQSTQMRTDYHTLQGKDAVDALPKYQQDLNELRQKVRGSLKTDIARKMYDSSALQLMTREVYAAAQHAATENKRYAFGASSARIQTIQDQAAHNPDDDEAFQRGEIQIRNEVHTTQAPIKGWGDEQAKLAADQAVSSLWAHRILGWTKTQPMKAQEEFEKNKDKIHGDDLLRVQNTVDQNVRITGSRVVADQYLDPLRRARTDEEKIPSEREIVDKALADPHVVDNKDPLFKDYVRQQIMAGYREFRRAEKEEVQKHTSILDEALQSGVKDVTSLKASSPAASAAFDALPPGQQNKWPAKINAYNNAKDKLTRKQDLQKLYGMADADPDAFIKEDLTGYNLSQGDFKTMLNLQRRKAKTPDQDPKVGAAMATIMPMIPESIRTDKNAMLTIRGSVQMAIEQHLLENKKMPNPKEQREMGARLLQEHIDPEKYSFFGMLTRKTPLAQMTIPSAAKEAIDKDYAAEHNGAEPNDEQRRQIYNAARYKELYGKSATKPVE